MSEAALYLHEAWQQRVGKEIKQLAHEAPQLAEVDGLNSAMRALEVSVMSPPIALLQSQCESLCRSV